MSAVQIGSVIGKRYEVLSRLGAGGMAAVYLCADRETGEEVAIKLMHEHLRLDQPVLVERFRREARLMVRLTHPETHDNLLGVKQVLSGDDGLGIVMEAVADGLGLDTFLTQGPLDEASTVAMMCQIIDGLDIIHQNAIIHRDLKPSNILLVRQPDGSLIPKIADFGIAKDLQADTDFLEKASPQVLLTQTASAFGSPAYMAPELFDSAAEASPQSDYYALGSVDIG